MSSVVVARGQLGFWLLDMIFKLNNLRPNFGKVVDEDNLLVVPRY